MHQLPVDGIPRRREGTKVTAFTATILNLEDPSTTQETHTCTRETTTTTTANINITL